MSTSSVNVVQHPKPTHEITLALLPTTNEMDEYIQSVAKALPQLDERYRLHEKGFSLLCTFDDLRDMVPMFYLTAGKRV